jgi:hypothetical protein
MAFCLPQNKVNEFKRALKSRRLDVFELMNMDTAKRTEILREYAGNDAEEINLLFEQKLVLKNKMRGLQNWASKVGQIGRYDPQKKAKIQEKVDEYKAEQQRRIFSPEEDEAFLGALAKKAMGTEITKEEAQTFFEFGKRAEDILNESYNHETGEWASKEARMEYGAYRVATENYVAELKGDTRSIKEQVKDRAYQFRQTWRRNAPVAIGDVMWDTIRTVSDTAIAMTASVDNSFLGRQGMHTLMTHPSAWWPAAKKSFVDFAKTMRYGDKRTMDALWADIYSSENYLNGRYQASGVLPKTEEQFPTSLPERIPVVGRVFTASENAFLGSGLRMRTRLFDLMTEMAKENGVDLGDKYQIESIGKIVNALTARGQWGKKKGMAHPAVRLFLWAPKMLKGNIDVLLAHHIQDISPFARKQAATNIAKIASELAVIYMISNALVPGSAEYDPRSSNFGRIKIGDTRFDPTGGMSQLVTLATRLALFFSNITGASELMFGKKIPEKKSSTTGRLSFYSKKIGEVSAEEAFIDFLEGKATPGFRILIDAMKGETWEGKKPKAWRLAYQSFSPIALRNVWELREESSADRIAGAIADFVGISSVSYKAFERDWEASTSIELKAFKNTVGEKNYREANELFNKVMNKWWENTKDNPVFQNLSDDDKRLVFISKQNEVKDNIFKQYGFEYKSAKRKRPKF